MTVHLVICWSKLGFGDLEIDNHGYLFELQTYDPGNTEKPQLPITWEPGNAGGPQLLIT